MTGQSAYDCIVIGTGGIGSATLFHLARRGARVLGIDQFPVAHDKGSSHGDTRAIRLVYFEHPDYVPLLQRAFVLWDELNELSDTPLFHKTGILQAGPPDGDVLKGLMAAARTHQLPMERLSPAQVTDRFDGFKIDAADAAIFDPNGGILRVEDCIETHARLAEAHGALLSTGETLQHWFPEHHKLTVVTDQGRYVADRLVLTAGAWAPQLLPGLAPHLHLRRKSLFWFENEDPCYTLQAGCPVFLFEQGMHTFYGFPALDDKGIKIADHAGGNPLDSPAHLDSRVDPAELEAVSLALRRNLPRTGHQLNRHTTCMYTMSEDGHFIVGDHPHVPGVSLVAGLSGHGFKFASVLGEVMADLALEGSTLHPIEFLSPARFETPR